MVGTVKFPSTTIGVEMTIVGAKISISDEGTIQTPFLHWADAVGGLPGHPLGTETGTVGGFAGGTISIGGITGADGGS